ncbi:MAG: hypothetical protein U0163_01635, partial [Gemmatimonadaceae bacterium]
RAEETLEEAVLRSLRRLDPSITIDFVRETSALFEEAEVLRARDATMRARPANVREHFKAQFRARVAAMPVVPRQIPRLRPTPADDPYGS